MVDAFGKPGSELMNYEIKWLGSYDECHAVKKEDLHNTSPGVTTSQRQFSGKYCTVSVEVGLGNMVALNRGNYMSANVLLNLLNELGKRDKMRGLPSILSLFRNEFDKFNNTRARMLDSIYHMTLSIL